MFCPFLDSCQMSTVCFYSNSLIYDHITMAESQSFARLRRLQRQRERTNECQFWLLVVASTIVAIATDAAMSTIAPTAAPNDNHGTRGRMPPLFDGTKGGAPAMEPDVLLLVAKCGRIDGIGSWGSVPVRRCPHPLPPHHTF